MRVVALLVGLALAAPVLPDDVAECNHEHRLPLLQANRIVSYLCIHTMDCAHE